MSGNRVKKLRAAFEAQTGWSEIHRAQSDYKRKWRKFKRTKKIER